MIEVELKLPLLPCVVLFKSSSHDDDDEDEDDDEGLIDEDKAVIDLAALANAFVVRVFVVGVAAAAVVGTIVVVLNFSCK
jgi:hypothetical protein